MRVTRLTQPVLHTGAANPNTDRHAGVRGRTGKPPSAARCGGSKAVIPAVAPAGDGFPPGQPPGPGRVPLVGQLVQVRSRHWLVEEVMPPSSLGGSARVSLACGDDDYQGQSLTVRWYHKLDRHILYEKVWSDHISGWSNCGAFADGHADPDPRTCPAFRGPLLARLQHSLA